MFTSAVGETEWEKGHKVFSRVMGMSMGIKLKRCIGYMATFTCKTDPTILSISVHFIIYKLVSVKNFIDTVNQRHTILNNEKPFVI